ncbi:MAG: Unknown protein [uncultured Sulfurovum sp.]|uniref:Lipoprotein n=1 Tax=uncultured Sulfurovum sp. TaxID=269237 RepID=A0A6S6SKY9_9BACT|nr:MAG: Unknown protein [uncultured Sulfurovum sp.]
MFRIFISLVFILLYNGCASSAQNSSALAKEKVQKVDRLKKYANTVGCKMLKSGYMVCPKSMNK